MGVEISFLIYHSYSLKDKRSVVKSIIKKMHNKHNISIAEIDKLDILNEAVIGAGVVSNSRKLCRQILSSVVKDVENNFEIEIYAVEMIE